MDIKKMLEDYIRQGENIKVALKKYVTDKSVPLEDRWSLFIESKMGEHMTCYWDFRSLDQEAFNDCDRFPRYSRQTVEDAVDYFENSYETRPITQAEVDQFKEEVLAKFIYSWENDW